MTRAMTDTMQLHNVAKTVVRAVTLKVGMAQMRVHAGQPQANLQRAVRFIADASAAGCDLVVLPECLDFGWCSSTARQAAQPIPGLHTQVLMDAARRHRIVVAAGLVERDGDVHYNAAVLISEEGALLLHHRKINEMGAAAGLYATGDRLGVAHTGLGCIGLNICADNLPAEGAGSLHIGHTLAAMGAQIIVSPCAWAVPPEHDNAATPYGALWRGAYGQLAAAHGLPVVGVSNVGRVDDGPWAGWPVIGASLAVGGDGQVAAQCDYGCDAEQLRVAQLALRPETQAGATA